MKELKRLTKSLLKRGQKALTIHWKWRFHASDLASRTEKLLVEHLEGAEVADDIRKLLAKHDRETTSIKMATIVANVSEITDMICKRASMSD